jgi:hypothetical protein
MAIEFPCECGQVLQAQDEHAGRRTRCPKCGREATIPGVRAAAPAPAPPRPEGVSRRPRPDTSHLEEDDDDDRDRNRRRRRRPQSSGGGATLWIVLGIVGAVLVLCVVGPGLLLIPAVAKVRQAAARMESQNNLKELAIAMHNYHSVYQELPPAVVYDRDGKPLYSWRVLILPFIEQEAIYRSYHLDEPWDSPHNKPLSAAVIKTFVLPGTTPSDQTYYRLFDGPGAAFDSDPRNGLMVFDPRFGLQKSKKVSRIPGTFPDGTSNTILIAEAGDPVPWAKPGDLRFDPNGPLPKLGGPYGGDFNVAMADASTRTIRAKMVSEKTLRAAITASGNDVLGQDW